MRTALVAAAILAACPVHGWAQNAGSGDFPRVAGVRSGPMVGRPSVVMPRATTFTNPAPAVFNAPTWGRNATSSLSGGSIFNPQKSRANGEFLNGTITTSHRRSHRHGFTNCGVYWGYSSGVNLWDPFPYGIDNRLIEGVQPGSSLAFPASAAAPAPAPEPPTTLEQARVFFEGGQVESAIEQYRRHLVVDREDFAAAAELGMVLIEAGRGDDGVAMISFAYSMDPALGSWPLSDRILLDSKRWRKIVVRGVQHANRRDSASAWLAVAVLMQAEGRRDVARRMLDRATDRGLDATVAGAMRSVLP